MKIFSGRVALVTGGASGIGYGLVQNFLKLGMRVVVVDYNRDYLEACGRRWRGSEDVTSCTPMSAIAIRYALRPIRPSARSGRSTSFAITLASVAVATRTTLDFDAWTARYA